MGLFDKLFGSSGSEVLNKIKDAAETVAKEASNAIKDVADSVSNSSQASSASQASSPAQQSSNAEFGCSWGDVMPAEENQFNYSGSYDQYFHDVYVQNFPTYRLTTEKVRKGNGTKITFWDGTQKALVVDLMSQKTTSRAVMNECAKENVPYLRFYYNHPGWWNTKTYVINRTRNALKI